MKTAIYTNKATGEIYKISGEDMNLEKAWGLWEFACRRMNWNPAAFCLDVNIKIIER